MIKISNFDSFNEGSMKDISSDKYELVWGDGPGRGTFIIIDKNDDSNTLRNTGADALEDYNVMKKLLTKGEDKFNVYVADNYTFTKNESLKEGMVETMQTLNNNQAQISEMTSLIKKFGSATYMRVNGVNELELEFEHGSVIVNFKDKSTG